MARRLVYNGRKMIEQLTSDLDQLREDLAEVRGALDSAEHWNGKREPLDVQRYHRAVDRALLKVERMVDTLDRRINGELEEMLQRREDGEPGMEERIQALEKLLAAPDHSELEERIHDLEREIAKLRGEGGEAPRVRLMK